MQDKEEERMEVPKTQQMQVGKQLPEHKIILMMQEEGQRDKKEAGFLLVRPIQVLQGPPLPRRIQNLND